MGHFGDSGHLQASLVLVLNFTQIFTLGHLCALDFLKNNLLLVEFLLERVCSVRVIDEQSVVMRVAFVASNCTIHLVLDHLTQCNFKSCREVLCQQSIIASLPRVCESSV